MQAKWKPLALAIAGAIGASIAAPALGYENTWEAAATGNSFSQSTAPDTAVIPLGGVAITGRPVIVIDRATGASTEVISVDPAPAVTTGARTLVVTPLNSASYDDWMNGNVRTEVWPGNALVSRRVYVDSLGRHYVAIDAGERGLTPAEASRLYGNVDSAAGLTLSGTGAQPGNMGPGNAKGQ